MVPAPPIRRRLVGGALRRYREAAGYPMDDAARVLGCDRSKISRIEIGLRGVRAAELQILLAEYGVRQREQGVLEIIADRGIDAKVGAVGWETICRAMEAEFSSGQFERGVTDGITAVSRELARHFPPGGAHPNELPDAPVVM